MRVGLALAASTDFGQIPALARQAEEAGFDLIASGEHVFFHESVPNGLIALAAAAGATERIRLLSALTLLPTYPAPLAAKMVATLDGVSNGRFEFGVGVGGEYPSELRACGVDPKHRGAYTDEALEIITALFTGEPVTYEGRFCTVEGDRLLPPPVQRPGPPIWIGGRKPAAFRRAGRFADVWMPYLMEPHQVAESLTAAREQAVLAGRKANALRGAYFAWSNIDRDGDRAVRNGVEFLSRAYNQDMGRVADRYLVLGTPERLVERLSEYQAAGVETVVIALASKDAGICAAVDLLATEVVPALRKLT
ncbi:LLM class flavin-dependent oxidoreductase [Sporichthya sp.]|uniref:LLM class flavin-dependent oxidoreductase n=1 Tax=Sporichthya sp. TaxID=65475 RepID=UPI00185641CA|nr:LLM class flavin-dependent oxidoreductase [Sporichthya sp.]MBA3742482.1 LLM class flavin-dependent oxidoreductase [Sporichthya sp.]